MPADARLRSPHGEGQFSVWFWRCGLAVWLILAIGFGLARRWDYFALSALWVIASMAGWSRGEKQLHV
jgi:hypothetical protein